MLRYDLSSIPECTVQSAKMRLYIQLDGTVPYCWSRVTSEWSESDMTPGTLTDGQWYYPLYSGTYD